MSSPPRPLHRHATSGSSRTSRASSASGLRRLPVLTLLFLAIVLLAWNLSFYQGLYIDHASAAFRRPTGQGSSETLVARGVGVPDAEAARAAAPDRNERVGPRLDGDAPPNRGGNAFSRTAPAPGLGAAGGPGSEAESESGAVVEDETLLYPGTDKVRVEGRRVDGLREGEWVEYYPDGTVMSRGSFLGDLREGPWVEYYPSGRTKNEGTYRAGLREGSWRSWHETGPLVSEGIFREARREEVWTQYYTNGNVMETGRYIDGRREGFWAFYTIDGTSDDRTGWYVAGRRDDR